MRAGRTFVRLRRSGKIDNDGGRRETRGIRALSVGFLLTWSKAPRQFRRQVRACVTNRQSTAMSSSLRVIVLCAVLVAWLPAQAQYLGPGIETNVALTKQDLAIMRHVVNEQVHGKPVGTSAKWSNPASQNSGKITLVRKFTRNGQQCETLDYRLTSTRGSVAPQHYRLSSCLQPDGQWRLI
jgi:surface antigen